MKTIEFLFMFVISGNIIRIPELEYLILLSVVIFRKLTLGLSRW